MLTRILLQYMARTALALVAVSVAVAYLLGGEDIAWSVGLGAVLVATSGAAQIWLVGFLLNPDVGTPQKLVSGFFLVFKLLIVCAVFWWVLTYTNPNQLGFLLGMGVGLASLVIGVQRGSSSAEGIAAANEAEQKIAEKMEDTDPEKR